jgi:hypothetical protein
MLRKLAVAKKPQSAEERISLLRIAGSASFTTSYRVGAAGEVELEGK